MPTFEGYRKTLSPLQVQIYDALKDGMSRHRKEIEVQQCTDEALNGIFESVLLDHPEIYYVKGYRLWKRQDSSPMAVAPVYTYALKEVKLVLESCSKAAEILISRAEGLDEYAQELFIHDLLLRVTYGDGHKAEAHSLVGPLLHGIGVCEGISKAAKFLFDLLGRKSFVVIGVAKTPKGHKDEPHAWNCIQTNGCWYHLDITFDNSLSGRSVKRYDYCNLSDYEIEADHKATKRLPVKCVTQQNYYQQTGAQIENKRQLVDFITKERSSGVRDIIVKFPFSEEEAYIMIREALAELNYKGAAAVSCNKQQMVFHLHCGENN